jgi:hypothetical protein
VTGRRRGCLWVAGAWVWFVLVMALVDMSVNDPTDRLVQALVGIVVMAPFITLTAVVIRRLRRRARA